MADVQDQKILAIEIRGYPKSARKVISTINLKRIADELARGGSQEFSAPGSGCLTCYSYRARLDFLREQMSRLSTCASQLVSAPYPETVFPNRSTIDYSPPTKVVAHPVFSHNRIVIFSTSVIFSFDLHRVQTSTVGVEDRLQKVLAALTLGVGGDFCARKRCYVGHHFTPACEYFHQKTTT